MTDWEAEMDRHFTRLDTSPSSPAIASRLAEIDQSREPGWLSGLVMIAAGLCVFVVAYAAFGAETESPQSYICTKPDKQEFKVGEEVRLGDLNCRKDANVEPSPRDFAGRSLMTEIILELCAGAAVVAVVLAFLFL